MWPLYPILQVVFANGFKLFKLFPDNGDRKPGDTDQSLSAVVYLNVPDMGFATDMQWRTGGPHLARSDRTQMVGIHFQSHTNIFVGVNNQIGRYTPDRFGQDDRRSAVQETVGLFHLVGHGHGSYNTMPIDMYRLDIQKTSHVLGEYLINFVKWVLPKPHIPIDWYP